MHSLGHREGGCPLITSRCSFAGVFVHLTEGFYDTSFGYSIVSCPTPIQAVIWITSSQARPGITKSNVFCFRPTEGDYIIIVVIVIVIVIIDSMTVLSFGSMGIPPNSSHSWLEQPWSRWGEVPATSVVPPSPVLPEFPPPSMCYRTTSVLRACIELTISQFGGNAHPHRDPPSLV